MKNYNEKVFKEQVGEYFSLINETPLYKGMEKVLLSKKLLEEVIERNECLLEDCEEEGEELNDYIEGITVDSVDCIVMELFGEKLIKNLIKNKFVWNEENETWIVPKKFRKTKYVDITGEQMELTNYGIIWDILPMDYDTCVREMISDIIDSQMVIMGLMEE
jgi:hypothetical protein